MKSLTKKHCLRSQVHLGHSASEWNPNMSSFLLGERDGSHIFDVSQTLFLLKRALKVIKKVASKDGQILFIGRSPKKVAKITKQNNPYDKIIENAAIYCSQPCMTGQNKWTNGTFTNWEEMIRQFSRKVEKQEIQNLKNASQSENFNTGEEVDLGLLDYKPGALELQFDNYKNKEDSSLLTKEIYEGKMDETNYYSKSKTKARFDNSWSWSNFHKVSGNRFSRPDLIFAIGISELEQPLKEANNVGIPIVAVVDSNQNPFLKNRVIDYIIPGNDDSIRSYAFFCMMVSQAVREGKSLANKASL